MVRAWLLAALACACAANSGSGTADVLARLQDRPRSVGPGAVRSLAPGTGTLARALHAITLEALELHGALPSTSTSAPSGTNASGPLRRVRHVQAGLAPCPIAPPNVQLPTPLPPILQQTFDKIGQQMDAAFKAQNCTGAVVSVVHDQRVIWEYAYGRTRNGTGGAPVDANTRFGIGSVSKVFTDLLLLQLTEAGKVSPSDQVSKYLPELKPKWPKPFARSKRGSTLRDLGSHMAGMPRNGPCPFGDCSNVSFPVWCARLSNYTLLHRPGTTPTYSNAGFTALGRLLEEPLGKTYEEGVQDAFDAANMSRSTTSVPTDCVPGPSSAGNCAAAYEYGEYVAPFDLGLSCPAGGLFSTGKDMAAFMMALFSESSPLLDPTTIRDWFTTVVHANPTEIPANAMYFDSWGMPWQNALCDVQSVPQLANFSRFRLVTKDGSVPGYNSQLVLEPLSKTGLFAAMSTGGEGRDDAFFNDVQLRAAFSVIPVVLLELEQLVQPWPTPATYKDYLGTYLSAPEYGSAPVHVSVAPAPSGNGLALTVDGPQYLRWVGDDTFKSVPDSSLPCWSIEGGIDYIVEFQRTPTSQGLVASFVIQGYNWYPAVFTKQP